MRAYRKVSRVILTKVGSEPIQASDELALIEAENGISLSDGETHRLIPWHRIYEIEYVGRWL